MLGIITTALIMTMMLSYGVTVFGQSVAPYSTCIKFTDHGYNITLQQDNDCNSKQFSETALYYQANGYHKVGNSNATGLQIMQLIR
jgi:hypothetical protein